MSEEAGAAELPKYKCHKTVWALKILSIEYKSTERSIDVAQLRVEAPYGPVRVGDEWIERHKPEPGGYYVVYADGYKSYSPAEAFEEGYTLMAKTETEAAAPLEALFSYAPTDAEIENRFRYHAPTPEAIRRHSAITEASIVFAKAVRDNVPWCDEAEDALKAIASARMLANAGIALNHGRI